MATDLIQQAQYLKENGFTAQQANTLIYFHKDSIENTLATKKDIEILKKDLILKLSGIMGSMITIGIIILGLLIKF